MIEPRRGIKSLSKESNTPRYSEGENGHGQSVDRRMTRVPHGYAHASGDYERRGKHPLPVIRKSGSPPLAPF